MTIRLHEPVASAEGLERLHYFPGRYLGEQEFDLRQRYAEARLGRLLDTARAGILRGLNTRLDQPEGAGTAVTVYPGMGVAGDGQVIGLYRSVTETWTDLVREYRDSGPGGSVRGAYYLVLERESESIDWSQDVDACRRFDLDPHRDTRREVVGRLKLRRLHIADVDVNNRMQIENLVAAAHVDATFLAQIPRGLPVGLLAMDGNGLVRWFSEAAGRYLAEPNSGFKVLLNQVNGAVSRTLQAADAGGDPDALRNFLVANLDLRYLPAAGQLPLELLRDRVSASPSLDWLPDHVRVDMIPVPVDSVAELVERHLPRRPFDLRQPAAGEHLRLLLAVNNAVYQRNLLDIPQPDPALQDQLFRYHMRAHDCWRQWREQFDRLHHLMSDVDLPDDIIESLDLPQPLAAPAKPATFYGKLIAAAHAELGGTDFNPYRHGVPVAPAFYRGWLVADAAGALLPPRPAEPTQNGFVVQHQIALVELERLDNRIRALRERLEKSRDFLLLQRQQLDRQTVSLAGLAGGVAGDGAGLQVARWLPFTKLLKQVPAKPPADAEAQPKGDTSLVNAQALAERKARGGSGFEGVVLGESAPATEAARAETVNFLAAEARFMPAALEPSVAKLLVDRPLQVSAATFTLNKEVLSRLAETPRQTVTRPAFVARDKQFGVLEHIQPEIHEYRATYRGMQDLLTTLDDLFEKTEAASIRNSLKKMGTPRNPEELAKIDDDDERIAARYEASFEAGKILTRQISFMEQRYGALEREFEERLASRVRLEARIDKLRAVIRTAIRKLALLDRRRIEQLGDYGMTQRLVDDDWESVYLRDQERARILEKEARGLFYVRVRNTPVSQSLPDPLALRHMDEDDLVPGCGGDEDADIPPELEDFFDAVLEVPMDDWRRLWPLRVRLPVRRRLDYGFRMRQLRLDQRQSKQVAGGGTLYNRLQPLRLVNTTVVHALASRVAPSASLSLKKYNEAAASVLSLEDLLTTANGLLRRAAQVQRDRLELAVACMLAQLAELPPSIRLQWAQLAEDDALVIDDVSRWPGLQVAEKADFNVVRTFSELLGWWFAQLTPAPSDEARAALSNMVRAILIHAALGDPSEIVQGEVTVPPRAFDIGALVRIKLNRTVNPGTLLHLMDEQQKVVGLLNVEDHDDKGTLANVVRADARGLQVNRRFTVTANTRKFSTGGGRV